MIRTSNRVRRVLARAAIAASVVVAPMLTTAQASAQPEPAAPAPQTEAVDVDQPGDNQAEFVHRGWRGHGFGGWYGRPFHGWNHHGWHGHGWNHHHVNPGWPAPAPWPGGGVRVILPLTGSAY